MDWPTLGATIRRLATQEYAPLALMIAFWSVIGIAVGARDTAYLLAAMTMARSILFLTRLSIAASLKRRQGSDADHYRQALKIGTEIQLGVLAAQLLVTALLYFALVAAGAGPAAAYLPYVAPWFAARALRNLMPNILTPDMRPFISGSGVVLAGLGLFMGWSAPLIGLAVGLREWLAMVLAILFLPKPKSREKPVSAPLQFAEVAARSFRQSQRVLAYRVAKTILGVFGPIGSATARTGRNLKWDRRIIPHIPKARGGFFGLAAAGIGIAAVGIGIIGGPIATVAGAGAMQIAGIALNICWLWPYQHDVDQDWFDDEDDD